MSDIRDALVALLGQADHAPMSTHDPRDGSCQSCPWPLHEMPPEDIADAILAEFDVTPRGEGMTIRIGGSRAGKTQALAERVADEVMKRGGSATVTSLPSVEDVARVLFDAEYHDIDATERSIEWGVVNGTDHARKHGTAWHRQARAVLALLPGRTEAEVKAEALREAAPGCNCEDDYARLNVRADRIEKEVDRG